LTSRSPVPELVRALRYRRHLGRTTLARGTRPKAPKISYSGFGLIGCLVVGVALPLLLTALFAVIVAVRLAIDVAIALGVLLLLRSFRNWVLPAFRGEPFDSRSFAKTSPVATFAMGAVPTAALAYAASPHPATIAIAALAGGVAFRPIAHTLDGKRLPEPPSLFPARKTQSEPVDVGLDLESSGDFGLWIGEATGAFSEMGHLAGLRAGSNVTLNLRDAAKNLAIFGETGTGKTTRVVNHLLVQALDFDADAFIFDVRGDFHTTATHAAQLAGKTIQRIGVGQLGVNLLDGLTPNTAAGFLEAAFKLLGQGEGDSAFWLSLAVARCQNALGVLNHVPGDYSLRSLYRYVFDDRFRAAALATANEALVDLQVHAADGDRGASLEMRRLKGALDYETRICSTALCSSSTCRASASKPPRVASTCFSKSASSKLSTPAPRWRRVRAKTALCSSSATNTSRSAAPRTPSSSTPRVPLNVVGIVAAQSMEAYINATGDEHAASALLANFTNVIAFRSTERTMNYLAGKLGDVDVWKQSSSAGKTRAGIFDVTKNEGRSLSEERRRLLGPQLFRALRPDHAVALLTVDGAAFDDVIRVPQITSDDL